MRNLLLLAVAGLTACATSAPAPPASGGICRGEDLSRFAGRPASPEMDAEVLRVSGARVLRRVAHGTAVTMEYNDQRATIWLTADNRVERVTCG